jgi:hypothetical protein
MNVLQDKRLAIAYDLKSPECKELQASFNAAFNAAQACAGDALRIMSALTVADLVGSYTDVFTQKWMRSSAAIKGLCATIDDYGTEVLDHLFTGWVQPVMADIRAKVVTKYVEAFCSQRLLKVCVFVDCELECRS